MKWLLFGLGLANVLLWLLTPEASPRVDPAGLAVEIDRLKAEIPDLEKRATWVERVNGVLADPPTLEPDTFLEVAGKQAVTAGFTMLQSRPIGGEPPGFAFSGFGEYAGVASFLGFLQGRPAAMLVRLELERRNDGKVRASCDVRIRSGPWQGDGGGDGLLEPVSSDIAEVVLGRTNLFGEDVLPPQAAAPRPRVRYVGYHEATSGLTVMLEIEGRSHLATVGEVPEGLRVVAATKTEIRVRGPSGDEWPIRLEGGAR